METKKNNSLNKAFKIISTKKRDIDKTGDFIFPQKTSL